MRGTWQHGTHGSKEATEAEVTFGGGWDHPGSLWSRVTLFVVIALCSCSITIYSVTRNHRRRPCHGIELLLLKRCLLASHHYPSYF